MSKTSSSSLLHFNLPSLTNSYTVNFDLPQFATYPYQFRDNEGKPITYGTMGIVHIPVPTIQVGNYAMHVYPMYYQGAFGVELKGGF